MLLYLQVVTSAVALGIIIARTRTVGPQSFYYTALMEQNFDDLSTFSFIWMSIGRFITGTIIYKVCFKKYFVFINCSGTPLIWKSGKSQGRDFGEKVRNIHEKLSKSGTNEIVLQVS